MKGFFLVVTSLVWAQMAFCTYQELTHLMDMETMMIPPIFEDEYYHFQIRHDQAGPNGNVEFIAWNSISVVEHMGTHFDAPYHLYEFGRKSHDIPLEDLHGPLVLIDIREKVAEDSKATVDVEDLRNWEAEHGPIPERAYILMFSGWSQYWGDQFKYVGTNTTAEPEKMAWPSFSVEAAQWLVENRDFLGLGLVSISCDSPNTVAVHQTVLPADKMCVENLNNLHLVPPSGAEFFHLPLLIK